MKPDKDKSMAAASGSCRTCRGRGVVVKGGKEVRCIDCGGKGKVGYRTK